MAAVLESRVAEIVVLSSGKRSVDGRYKLLSMDIEGKPAYERLEAKKKERFLFFKKQWTIGGVLGCRRAGVLTFSTEHAVWQRYTRTADGPIPVPCPAMAILDASTAPSSLPPAKKRRTQRHHNESKLLRLPATAVAAFFSCLGIKARFLLGAACKAARVSVLDTPRLWHTVHFDTATLSELQTQTTHVRKQAIGWLDTSHHPMHNVHRLYVYLHERRGMFKWHHHLLLRPFLKVTSFVRITGCMQMTSPRDFLLFVVPSAMPAAMPRRLPHCAVTAQRFVVTRDDEDTSVGMSRATALSLLQQGKFFEAYFPGLQLSAFGRADWFARTPQHEAEQFCQRMKESLSPGELAKVRVRII